MLRSVAILTMRFYIQSVLNITNFNSYRSYRTCEPYIVHLLDPSFPSDGAVELIFARGEGSSGAAPAPTPAAPLRAAPDALARADSLEHLRPLSTITDDDTGRVFYKC